MKLPAPPNDYNANDQAQTRRLIEVGDAKNQKLASAYVLTAPDGSRWKLVVSTGGVVTALPA